MLTVALCLHWSTVLCCYAKVANEVFKLRFVNPNFQFGLNYRIRQIIEENNVLQFDATQLGIKTKLLFPSYI